MPQTRITPRLAAGAAGAPTAVASRERSRKEKTMTGEELGYFEVLAKCGHVGRKHYVLKRFAIRAESANEAARITRNIPRVKHHHKDAIRSVTAVTPERYAEIVRENSADPFSAVTACRISACTRNRKSSRKMNFPSRKSGDFPRAAATGINAFIAASGS